MSQAFRNPTSAVRMLLRTFSAGIILGLAMIHILPEGFEQVGGLASERGGVVHEGLFEGACGHLGGWAPLVP